MRVFLSFIFRENSSERLSIRDTLHTFVGEKGARERNGGGDGTFQFPPSLTESYLHKGGRAIRKSRRGRWTDSKWSIKLEISEHTVYTRTHVVFLVETSPRALDRLSKSEAFGQECGLRSV